MRILTVFLWLSGMALTAVPCLAMLSGGPKDEGGSKSSIETRAPLTTRQEAERWYGDAYGDVAKANKELADGKEKNAQKRFKRGLERGERAVALDSTYYEAMNLVGYCARNLRQYDKSLAAYTRCLGLKPDYAPAREYLGELYVELGDVARAREQLAWLERLEAADAVSTLKAKIDARTAAQPDSSLSKPAPEAADSTATRPPGGGN
jgi:tetratricopeptide (TPR) repeat protein